MQKAPANWYSLWGKDNTVCSYQITIGSEVYPGDTDIEDGSLILNMPVFTADAPIGNTPCFSMECCLRKHDTPIPKGATLSLEVRLENGDEITDFVFLGFFKIYNRINQPDGWVKLNCRNKMQMANQSFFEGPVDNDQWPQPMSNIMRQTTDRIGIQLDPRTTINEGPDWMIPPPVGMSIRAVWSYIAAAHGGNFILTPQDTLLLIRPKTEGDPVDVELSADGFELLGEEASIDQITLKLNSSYGVSAGEPGDNDIEVDCPYGNGAVVSYVKEQLTGTLYTPLRVSNMLFDPAAEVQDTFTVNGLATTWSQLTIHCGSIPFSDGVAEAMSEPANEYGFEDTPFNNLETKIDGANQYADSAAQSAVDGLTQEDIFNKLTGNGEAQGIYIQDGQIYINASYLASGLLSASLIKAGVLQSADGSFYLNLDTGEFVISGYASSEDLENLKAEGVEKVVTPLMKYSLSDEGLRIQKPGEEIDNTIDNLGMRVSRGVETMLRADKDGVLATDVQVRNYLILGENARFEDYNDGSDSHRTGCFHI